MNRIVPINLLIALTSTLALAQNPCAGSRNLKLVNGKIVTMAQNGDQKNSTVSSVLIHDGVFESVGGKTGKLPSCTQVIDVHGRTVVPGKLGDLAVLSDDYFDRPKSPRRSD